MGFSLDKVVPWGRCYDEYVEMFNLTADDLKLRILGCGDGPASFNARLTKNDGSIISIDPIYVFDAQQIRSRINETYEVVIAQMTKNQGDYIWDTIPSIAELGRIRMSAMADFLTDYEDGKREGRYLAGGLPNLSFENGEFDLALSSHFLFLYSEHLSAEFHLHAIKEMLRVAREVRIFPVLTLNGIVSPHLSCVIGWLREYFAIEIRQVPYQFQRGGNEMLVIKPSQK